MAGVPPLFGEEDIPGADLAKILDVLLRNFFRLSQPAAHGAIAWVARRDTGSKKDALLRIPVAGSLVEFGRPTMNPPLRNRRRRMPIKPPALLMEVIGWQGQREEK